MRPADRSLGVGRGYEGSDLAHELCERGFVAKENMICAVKIYEARPGDASRKRLAFLEWNCGILPGVQNQRWNAYLSEDLRNVHVSKGMMESTRVYWGGSLFL